MSTNTKGPKIVARTFFQQLRANGYTQNEIIGVASELIELVTCELRDREKAAPEIPPEAASPAVRPNAA